jgi:alkanesulfonate monooxygenase SsuD/methylene tetrahydromethanopterin reductase-like flavin-dependent oxidoreductase (luciferase family)
MPHALRIGLQLPEVERDVRWPEYRAIAAGAEAAGFDSLWLGDHLLYRGDGRPERGPWEVWTLMSALAAATDRVTIGPLVACTAFHPPGLIAKMAATVDEVSGGRFVLGLGAGWNEPDFVAFGLPYDRLVSRFAESFEVIRGLLAGDRVTLQGRYHQADDLVLLPPPQRRVPLVIGSNGPRMLSLTLPYVDAWNTWFDGYGNDPRGFAELNARISAAAEQAGRNPAAIERSACVAVVVDGGGERTSTPGAPAVPADRLSDHLAALSEAGADEAILVVDPITESSVERLAAVL